MGDLRAVLGARMTVLHVIVLSSYAHEIDFFYCGLTAHNCEPLALLLLTCVWLIAELRIQIFCINVYITKLNNKLL